MGTHEHDIKTAEAVARIEAKLDAFVEHQRMYDALHDQTRADVERLKEGHARMKGAMWIVGVIWTALLGLFGIQRH